MPKDKEYTEIIYRFWVSRALADQDLMVFKLEIRLLLIWTWRSFSHCNTDMVAGWMACWSVSVQLALWWILMKIMTLWSHTLVETGGP